MDTPLQKNRMAFMDLLTHLLAPHDCVLCDVHVKDFFHTGMIPIAWLDVLFFCVKDAAQFDHACTLMNATQKVAKKNGTRVTHPKKLHAVVQKRSPSDSTSSHKSIQIPPKMPLKKGAPWHHTSDAMLLDLSQIIERIVTKTCLIVRHSSGCMMDFTDLQAHVAAIFPGYKLIIDAKLHKATVYDHNDRRIHVCTLPDQIFTVPIRHHDNTIRT